MEGKRNSYSKKESLIDWQKLKIGILYLWLFLGGLWHILSAYQNAMRVLASPVIIGITVWLFVEYLFVLSSETQNSNRKKFIFWCLIVIIGSFLIELSGVKTGLIFGRYSYGKTLKPLLLDVPVSIGFAWLGILLSSIAVIQRTVKRFTPNIILYALLVAFLMFVFDLFMEPAATKLKYWQWIENEIPLQNYTAWFALSFLFSYLGLRIGLFREQMPAIVFHAYFAQLLYFGMVSC